MPLMLASTSRYRRELLERLRLPLHIARPEVDETPQDGESVPAMAARLAHAKAEAIARQHPGAWVIGSDQAAELDGQPLGKPGHREAALAQLASMSGRQVRFHTAVCLVRDGDALQAQDVTTVRFRTLSTTEIERYVDAEQPFDCAGSFKSEGLGIALFDAIESTDPTALVGLPLIAVSRMLREAGFELP
ncbi:Maf family nucleotide pyrophosphatase [Pseudoxanthomonas sp. PXM01]|uniref:Maf family protein n=1 Tax=Pseudoxanthomonas sp. PXM01 TaxID=2769295 RepID=UPI00177B9932|nr:Maf family nucleotide pyrophosphatase [Pseudoxanthomonas sp. PXM01]MBD9469301.1 septum formation inhibitor Maf [Pseudoxanthomonas sp. PXM01]